MKRALSSAMAGFLLLGSNADSTATFDVPKNSAEEASAGAQSTPEEGYKTARTTAVFPRPPKQRVTPSRIIPVRRGQYPQWTNRDFPEPTGYRMGDMLVVVSGPAIPENGPRPDFLDAIPQQIRIQAPGRPDYVFEDDYNGVGTEHRFGYGLLDRQGTRFVLRQYDTGGSQCCDVIDLFILHPERTEHVELGEWGYLGLPDVRDHDGDGRADFVVADDSFYGEFTSPGRSRTPPMILNVIDGKVRDVSTKPAFRPVFARAAQSLRGECTRAKYKDDQDGACPAYVAAAARAGFFAKAWAETLSTLHHRNRVINIYGKPDVVEEERYAEKLGSFLLERGYTPGDVGRPH